MRALVFSFVSAKLHKSRVTQKINLRRFGVRLDRDKKQETAELHDKQTNIGKQTNQQRTDNQIR
jgi:hypothetical protein